MVDSGFLKYPSAKISDKALLTIPRQNTTSGEPKCKRQWVSLYCYNTYHVVFNTSHNNYVYLTVSPSGSWVPLVQVACPSRNPWVSGYGGCSMPICPINAEWMKIQEYNPDLKPIDVRFGVLFRFMSIHYPPSVLWFGKYLIRKAR